jgi:hypothetical protein
MGVAEPHPERATIWAVFCGEANEEGVIQDSQVRSVYDTKDAATAHVEYANEALAEVGQIAGLVYWVESWDVRSGAFDPDDEEAL